MNDFTIVTISTRKPSQEYYTYEEFFRSLKRYNEEPLVITPDPNKRFGLGDKPKLLKKAIIDGTIKTRYVMFVDCWDLVFAGKPSDIMDMYFGFNAPFVCSSEKNCYPGDLKDKFPTAPTEYAYLNSGFIISDTDALMAIFDSMDIDNVPDDYWSPERNCMIHINDQFLYHEEFIKQPVRMVLDYTQMLCQTLHSVKYEELDFEDKLGIRNKATGSYPFSYHFNGDAKTSGLREPILERLRL